MTPLGSALWRLTFDRMHVRRLPLPTGVRVVAVGGATLGGSGKTPLAIACALALARAGARTALVGHAYRARPGHARFVLSTDPLHGVGDEALVAARALAGSGARVVVAPRRSDAIAFAGAHADALVLDGVAQTAPRRACLALLALDDLEPWGHCAALPPRGELRAPRSRLLQACDLAVQIGFAPRGPASATVVSRGARLPSGEWLPWSVVRGLRTGLLTAIARPERVVRSLARVGVMPLVVVSGRNHGPIHRKASRGAFAGERGVELWLATAKCALHAHDAWSRGGACAHVRFAPLATLDYALTLSDALIARVTRLALP